MIVPPKIVAVDDDPEHLESLRKAFFQLGGQIHCIEFVETHTLQMPIEGGVRLLFMDINLMPGAGGDDGARTFSPIAATIRRVINNKNGPYALITWTNAPNLHDALIEHINERVSPDLRPCASYCLSKEEYLENPRALHDKLQELEQELPGLALLLDWERAVARAADRSVLEIATLSDSFGLAQGNAIASAVKAICEASAGQAQATRQPFRSFAHGMSALLTDQLDRGMSDPKIESSWGDRLQMERLQLPNRDQLAALNRYFHVDLNPSIGSNAGSVYDVLFKDVEIYLRPQYRRKMDAITGGEFIPIKNGKLQANADKKSFTRKCLFRLIQLGAPCDHANGKIRVADCLLAVEVPKECFDDTDLINERSFRDMPARREWLFQTPPFRSDNKMYVYVVNLRYRISIPLEAAARYKCIARLREGLANEIASHSASFSTRPGIIEFRQGA